MSRHATASDASPSGDVARPLEGLTLEGVKMRDEATKTRELIEQLVVSPPSPERSWLSIEEASALINRTPAAVRLRCRVKKIGIKVNGKWRVDRARLLSQN